MKLVLNGWKYPLATFQFLDAIEHLDIWEIWEHFEIWENWEYIWDIASSRLLVLLCSNGSASLFIKFTKDLKLFWLELRISSLQSKILELLFWDKRRVRYWWNPCLPLLRNAKVVVSFICVHKLENLLIAIEP